MIYFIERTFEDLPFDKTMWSMNVHGKIYDLVKSGKDTGLDSISDFVIDGDVFVKADQRLLGIVKENYESHTGESLRELLLG